MVVMSGPDATAGSTFSHLKIIGITVPDKLERTIDSNSATPVQRDIEKANSGDWPLNSTR